MNEGKAGLNNLGQIGPNHSLPTHPSIGHGAHVHPTVHPPMHGQKLPPMSGPLPTGAHRPSMAEEPLSLVDEARADEPPSKSKIHGITSVAPLTQQDFKRPLHTNNTGANRMRTFHCRLSEQGVEYLDQSINSWLDQHPEVEIKFSSSVVGMWDGKLKEPALIITVWY